jgi:hypothetical protein
MKALFASVFFTVSLMSNIANAGLITTDEWHNTNDAFGGLKMSLYSDDVFLAVSKSGVFHKNDDYQMLDGYRLMASSEYQDIITSYVSANGFPPGITWPYYNQGGWSGYDFESVRRYYFTYSDTNVNGIVHHVGQGDTNAVWGTNAQFLTTNVATDVSLWAGFVLIKDDSNAAIVPEPTTLAIFALGMIGLASRRFNKKS